MLGWGARQRGHAEGAAERVFPTKALSPFLRAVALRPAPVLIDLGAVVGSNVTFFGERLGCKLLVEDVFADIERFARDDRLSDLPSFLEQRFPQADESVDGIICWDVFDFLDKPAAQAVGRALSRILRPGGALLAFFAAARNEGEPHYTRFVIQDEQTLQHRTYAASCGQQGVLSNRDIALLFPGLKVSDSFLLLTHTREVLLRK